MRQLILCLVLLTLSSPVAAAPSLADQAQSAFAVFAGGQSQQDFLSARYGQAVFGNLGGNWVRLGGPNAGTGIETYGADTDKMCKEPTKLALAAPDAVTLTLTTSANGHSFSQSYTLIAGSTFGESTPAAPYLEAIGLGAEKSGPNIDQQRALALSLANGLVQIYRPSDDVVVFTRDRGYPIVLVRCPVK